MRSVYDCNEEFIDMRNYILYSCWSDMSVVSMRSTVEKIEQLIKQYCNNYIFITECMHNKHTRYIKIDEILKRVENFSITDNLMSINIYGVVGKEKKRKDVQLAITRSLRNSAASVKPIFDFDMEVSLETAKKTCKELLTSSFYFIGHPEGVDLDISIDIFEDKNKYFIELTVSVLGYSVEYRCSEICDIYNKIMNLFIDCKETSPYYASISFDSVPCIHQQYHCIPYNEDERLCNIYKLKSYEWSMLLNEKNFNLIKDEISSVFIEDEIEIRPVSNMFWITLTKPLYEITHYDKTKLKQVYSNILSSGYSIKPFDNIRRYGEMIIENSSSTVYCLLRSEFPNADITTLKFENVYVLFHHGSNVFPESFFDTYLTI